MAVTPRYVGTIDGKTNAATMKLIVYSGVTVNAGDFVYFSGGYVTNSTIAASRIIGQAQSKVVGDGTKTVLVIVEPNAKYIIDNDNDTTTFAATHVGTYFDLIGATGAQKVDTSTTSATTGQVLCLEYNPQISPLESDTSVGLFKIAEHALYPLGS